MTNIRVNVLKRILLPGDCHYTSPIPSPLGSSDGNLVDPSDCQFSGISLKFSKCAQLAHKLYSLLGVEHIIISIMSLDKTAKAIKAIKGLRE